MERAICCKVAHTTTNLRADVHFIFGKELPSSYEMLYGQFNKLGCRMTRFSFQPAACYIIILFDQQRL